MIGKVVYRGVVFGVYAMSSTHEGTSVVRPMDVLDENLAGLLLGMDIRKCVGKAHKVDSDVGSDWFGIHQASCRCYRMLIGMAKIRVNDVLNRLNEMQEQSRKDQNKVQDARYPQVEKKGMIQRIKAAVAPKQIAAKSKKAKK